MRSYIFVSGAIAAILATTAPAQAATSSGLMPVEATLLESCTVVATPMLFGILPNVGQSNIDVTASLAMVCTLNADYDIAMDDGMHANAGVRRMKGLLANDYINYQIFRDAARTQPWGNQAGVNTLAATAPLGLNSHLVYGRIPVGASSGSASLYTDIVTVTVDF